MKPGLLFLVHRIPYPPNKGDKIRSFNLLRVLAKDYRVYLGTFIDDAADREFVENVEAYCEESRFFDLNPKRARIKSLSGFLSHQALTVPYYHDSRLDQWVERTLTGQGIERVVVFSSSMAQYVLDEKYDKVRRVVDYVDMDSDKWRQYASTRAWPLSWVFAREAKQLQAYETRIIQAFDAGLFVSRPEADLFNQHSPGYEHKVGYAENGVDLEYASPDIEFDSPYPADVRPLVFVGSMDYWPNVDAVVWFAGAIFPKIKAQVPAARFYVVGGHPVSTVNALAKLDGVIITGRVTDVRPYVAHGAVSIAPMRIARGVQNKVLESMSMGRPTVVTEAALEGIQAVPDRDLLLAENATKFAEQVIQLLGDPERCEQLGEAARDFAEQSFDWNENLASFAALLESDSLRGHVEGMGND